MLEQEAVYELYYLYSLLQTVVIETIVLFFAIRKIYKWHVENSDIIFLGIFCTFATLPYVWFILPMIKVYSSYMLYVLISELFVLLVEMIILYKVMKVSYRDALVLATLMNLSSYLLGELYRLQPA